MLNKKHFALFAVAFVAVGAGLFSTVWFVTQETSPSDDQKHFSTMKKLLRDAFTDDGARDDIDKVDGQQIKSFLAQFASFPHMAGQVSDEYLAVVIKDLWLELGLDEVKLLFSYYTDSGLVSKAELFKAIAHLFAGRRYNESAVGSCLRTDYCEIDLEKEREAYIKPNSWQDSNPQLFDHNASATIPARLQPLLVYQTSFKCKKLQLITE